MPGRVACDIVRPRLHAVFTRPAIEIRRAQARDNRQPAAQDAVDQLGTEVDEAKDPAQPQELEVAVGRVQQAQILCFQLALPHKALADVDAGGEPGRIEHRDVVGVEGGAIPLA